jgi:hypothetical protein
MDFPVAYTVSTADVSFKNYLILFFYRAYQRLMINFGLRDQFEKYIGRLAFVGPILNFDNHFHSFSHNSKAKSYLIAGYFQSESYFSSNADIWKSRINSALSRYCQTNGFETDGIDPGWNDVAISCRLGSDYKQAKDLYVCPPDFYTDAVKMLTNYGKNDFIGYVFSDDLSAAKNLDFSLKDVHYVSAIDDIHGLFLLKNFRRMISANSSYSWWGGYLSDFQDSSMLVPERWYISERKESALYRDSMTRCKVNE